MENSALSQIPDRGRGLRANPLVKCLAVLLSIAAGVASFFGWVYCGTHWDALFDTDDYTCSAAYGYALDQKVNVLTAWMDLSYDISQGRQLTYLETQNYETLQAQLDPAQTNFRYTIRDNTTGELLYSSSGRGSLDGVDETRMYLYVPNGDYDPSGRSDQYDSVAGDGSRYYAYNDSTGFYDWYLEDGTYLGSTADTSYPPPTIISEDGQPAQWAVEYGVTQELTVQDAFYDAMVNYSKGNIKFFYLTIALTGAYLFLLIYLICCAGRRRGSPAFVLNWQDKIPYDLYLCLIVGGASFLFAAASASINEILYFYQGERFTNALYTTAIGTLAAAFGLITAGLMSTAARIKTHTLFRNTLIYRLLRWLGGLGGKLLHWWDVTFGSWSLSRKVILGFLLYLLGTLISSLTIILIPIYQGAVLYLLCRWSQQWQVIRTGTQAIVGGTPETVIDTEGMAHFPDLLEHAGQLNDLGSAINSAVDERLKSERMKAELITNVSHDLKTPLTSIINYVDLLKKEDIEGETAREYIDVLDRKSQRLKKLTEDLVEASKASTGALPVNREQLGMVQLVTQALGEYDEKFAVAQLTPVVTLPDGEVLINADGRHVWRIIDNLLGNCVKYAMPGTRVYLDLARWNGNVILSVKNISAQQLNVPAEQLMERFVRGDESRTTEGSGLGLSIARSLTELQGGTFRLEVDGDLFKAVVGFPEVEA